MTSRNLLDVVFLLVTFRLSSTRGYRADQGARAAKVPSALRWSKTWDSSRTLISWRCAGCIVTVNGGKYRVYEAFKNDQVEYMVTFSHEFWRCPLFTLFYFLHVLEWKSELVSRKFNKTFKILFELKTVMILMTGIFVLASEFRGSFSMKFRFESVWIWPTTRKFCRPQSF